MKSMEINTIPTFGCCPNCGTVDATYHIGRYHYEACHTCRVRWCVGLLQCSECTCDTLEKGYEKLDEWEQNKRHFSDYELVQHGT